MHTYGTVPMNPQENLANLYLDDIKKAILAHGSAVMMLSELRELYKKQIPQSLRLKVVEELLERDGTVQRVTLRSDEYGDLQRVAIPSLSPTPYNFALSIRGGAYLSHGSAVHLLGLTEQQPRTIYVNKEQSLKPRPQQQRLN